LKDAGLGGGKTCFRPLMQSPIIEILEYRSTGAICGTFE
jgi:hypothetical protein